MLPFSLNFTRFTLLIGLLLLSFISAGAQALPMEPAAKLLPNKLGEFRAAGPETSRRKDFFENGIERNGITSVADRGYFSKDGQRFSITLITTTSDSRAYALLTEAKRRAERSGNEGGTATADIGTSSFSLWNGLANNLSFFKGRVYAFLHDEGKTRDARPLLSFGKNLAETLDKGEGDIPVLVKHLPDGSKANDTLYAVTLDSLKQQFQSQTVFDAVSFEGSAEAVSANYGDSELVIIEFNTPQLAGDNDRRIAAKIQELRSQGQPVPTAYRRVGNYSAFVFNAPSEQAANQLIDQVKYQQVVQWLGNNPYLYEQATREFTETTLGVFVAVVKASGLALVTCFAVGGFFGALLFSYRRAQRRTQEAFSDAGGMLRLNLDEMTPQTDTTRLIGRGN